MDLDLKHTGTSLQLCNKMTDLYEQKLLCDITFSAYRRENELSFIPTHRAILAMGSPVFHAMFLGDLACARENLDEVVFVSDLSAEGLDNLFRFIYSNVIDLENLELAVVAETMMAAKKYLVANLENLCWYYLTSIDTNSYRPLEALKVLRTVYSTDDEDLIDICLSILDHHFEEIRDTQDFLHLEPEILIRIISRNSLISPEVVIFKACLQWAANFNYNFQCRSEESLYNGDRDSAFEILKPHIRFLSMSFRELVKYARPSGMLSFDDWFTLLACKQLGKCHPRFVNSPRHYYGLWTINDIMNVYDSSSGIVPSAAERTQTMLGAIEFKANQRFALGGVRVFNPKPINMDENDQMTPKLHMLLYCLSREEVIGEFELNMKPSSHSNNSSILNTKTTVDGFMPRTALVCFPHLWYRLVITYNSPDQPCVQFQRCIQSWHKPDNSFEIQFRPPYDKESSQEIAESPQFDVSYASFLGGLLFRNIG